MFKNDLGPEDLEGIELLVAELEEKLEENGYNPADYIYTTKGAYELQESIEASADVECLVIKNPTVTEEIAFSSAFAVVDRGEKINEKAMEMIYAINMDKGLRNLLQYGVADINYKVVDGDIVGIKGATSTYSMNIKYTGNMFIASYSSEIGWIKSVHENGILQNKEAVAE